MPHRLGGRRVLLHAPRVGAHNDGVQAPPRGPDGSGWCRRVTCSITAPPYRHRRRRCRPPHAHTSPEPPAGSPPAEQDEQREQPGHDAAPDLVALLPAARAAREALSRQGRSLTRDSLAVQIRRDGQTIRTSRASALLSLLKNDEPAWAHRLSLQVVGSPLSVFRGSTLVDHRRTKANLSEGQAKRQEDLQHRLQRPTNHVADLNRCKGADERM